MTLRDGSSGESAFFGGELPATLAPGMVVAARYELIRKIGAGSMGEVWSARHLSLAEEVAIKLVIRKTAEDGSSTDSRFLFEARTAAQLSRKTRHIVTVTDHGEHGAYAYLVMDLLKGESLDTRLARSGPLSPAQVVPILYQISRALSVAHSDGIIHRDLKTSNVFVTVDEDGRALVKILDFGIAKMRGSMARVPVARPAPGSKHATMHGFLLGTPPYMSPEQACGDVIDHRADVWALGVLAYHLLTTELPFDADTPEALLARICAFEATPIATYRPDLPGTFTDLFARAFAPALRDRFQSAVDFAHAFELASHADLRAISLPPPAGPVLVEDPETLDEPRPDAHDTLIAAGVPQRRRSAPVVFASLFVLGLAAALATVLFIYFEPMPSPRPVTSAALVSPPSDPGRAPPPPPEPAPIVIEDAPRPPSPPLRAVTIAPAPAPVESLTAASTRPPSAHSYDRSELF